jgi:hypothetical protein
MNARILMLGCLGSLVACGGGAADRPAEGQGAMPATQAAMPSDVSLAVTVARAIAAAPASMDSILAANGLTRESLDSLMYVIAADSAKSAAYIAAIR